MPKTLQKPAAAARSENINIRVTPETLGLIDRAAQVFGKTRTDFILDTVREAAEDAVLDQQLFVLNKAQWQAFRAALDTPPPENPGLRDLLARTPAWSSKRPA
ncbi:MAG: DUF1778 domain-containing protein [Beijerinckiaceae bacterium]